MRSEYKEKKAGAFFSTALNVNQRSKDNNLNKTIYFHECIDHLIIRFLKSLNGYQSGNNIRMKRGI